MKTPPFHYGSPVIKKSFLDRKKEIDTLKKNLASGTHTAVLAPNGWGKTSLVHKALNEFTTADTPLTLLEINLFQVQDIHEFLVVFARSVIMASSEKWNDWIQMAQEFFPDTKPTVNLGTRPDSEFTLEFNHDTLFRHPGEILNLPEKLGSGKDLRYVIFLDDFHQFEKMNGFDAISEVLKTTLEQSSKALYILAGNTTPWTTALLSNPGKGFKDLLEVVQLSPIEPKIWIKYLRKGFTKSGKSLDDATAKSLLKRVQGHPFYVQQLARFTWLNSGNKAGKKELNKGFNELMAANQALYRKTLQNLSATQINLLKAISHEEKHLTGSRVMERYRLGTPRNVAKNRDMLLRKEVIHKSGDQFLFLDPAFEHWFREQLFS